jgi:hypothetical protein
MSEEIDIKVKKDLRNHLIRIVTENLEKHTDLSKSLVDLLAGAIYLDFSRAVEITVIKELPRNCNL